MPRSKKKRTRILWTTADLKQLKSLAGRQAVSSIAKRLGRTAAAVRRKATLSGISLAMK